MRGGQARLSAAPFNAPHSGARACTAHTTDLLSSSLPLRHSGVDAVISKTCLLRSDSSLRLHLCTAPLGHICLSARFYHTSFYFTAS